MSIRVNITVEGKTEELFVRNVLEPYLSERSVWIKARRVLTSKDRRTSLEYRGGFRKTYAYAKVQEDICTWMKEDRNADARFTTMFDLYALPTSFPGYGDANRQRDPYERIRVLENAFFQDINQGLNDRRFIPYIQLHEFEALIFSDPQKLECEFLEHNRPIQRVIEMVRREGGNPELINDGPETAPSKRIIAEIPEYRARKAEAGALVAKEIGLETLLARCRHFSEWVNRLAKLAN